MRRVVARQLGRGVNRRCNYGCVGMNRNITRSYSNTTGSSKTQLSQEEIVEQIKELDAQITKLQKEGGELKDMTKHVNKQTGEIGGPPGPEPTRYGDWNYKGRTTDFE
eukprot:TRINITY_DN211_c0_g1_i1.p1 TRINITY_DN211_c0_g1~~TRINITY_DN211_c0_g1_i1.p1  ORF type:complete len:108 (+),score=33.10 TRINITY_DN211_c0_g1_i1:39-362(+)